MSKKSILKKCQDKLSSFINEWIVFISIGLVLLFLGAYIFNFREHNISSDPNDWNNLGGYLGGIFSALAFLVVVFQMQNDRKRFEEDRKNQEKQTKKDEFNRRFFLMLDIHKGIISQLLVPYENKVKTVFDFISEEDRFMMRVYLDRLQVLVDNLKVILSFVEHEDTCDPVFYIDFIKSLYSKNMVMSLKYYSKERKDEKLTKIITTYLQ